MARLMECRDCGNSVSKSADFCPKCGRRFKLRWYEGRWSTVFKAVIGFFLFILIASILIALVGS